MRDPFHMTGDCTFVSVNVDVINFIPTGLPFCTIPGFTEPTLVARMPEVLVPDMEVPDICRCYTFDVVDVTKTELNTNNITFHVTHSPDCCDLAYLFSFGLNWTCIAAEFTHNETVYLGPGLNLNLNIGPAAETCKLSVDIDLEIPCFPLDVQANGSIHTGTYLSLNLDFTRLVSDETCVLKFSIDIKMPELVLTCGDLSATNIVNIEQSQTSVGDFDVIQTFTDPCVLNSEYSIKFPYNFSSGDLVADGPEWPITYVVRDGAFGLTLFFTGCELNFGYWLAFPLWRCRPEIHDGQTVGIEVLHTDIVSYSNDIGLGQFDFNFYWEDMCDLMWSHHIKFPKSLSCDDLAFTRTGVRDGTGTFNLSSWIDGDEQCTFKVNYRISFPDYSGADRCSELTVDFVHARPPECYEFTVFFKQRCTLYAEHRINLDCIYENVCEGLTVYNWPFGIDGWCCPPGRFYQPNLYFDDCNIHASFRISFPDYINCGNLDVEPLNVDVAGPGKFEVNLDFDNCELDAEFYISFPDEFSCGELHGSDWLTFLDFYPDCVLDHKDSAYNRLGAGPVLRDLDWVSTGVISKHKYSIFIDLAYGHPYTMYDG